MEKKNLIAIILMGGDGKRFGEEIPKQLYHLGGIPVFVHTVKKFLQTKAFEKIILPTPLAWIDFVENHIKLLGADTLIQVIPGGRTRQESSYAALQACPKDTAFVIIHDSVRPFVSSSILEENIQKVSLYHAVDTCIQTADTLVHSLDGSFITSIPSRDTLLRGQTPQSFSYPLILEAHEKALAANITNSSDDCSLVMRLGHPVHIVEGSEYNIKITTKLDLFMAERLLYYPSAKESLGKKKSDLQGKIFAITGGTGGIGNTLCEELSAKGATILSISQTAKEFTVDLTNFKQAEALFAKLYKQYGPLDGIINSIGSFSVKDLASMQEIEIQEVINTNLLSVIYACKCSYIKQGGHIVNISSSCYSRGRKEYPIYSATKAAVVNFTQALAEERPDLFVNVIVPQRTKGAMRAKYFPDEDDSLLLDPKQISAVVTELLEESPFTGNILEIRKN